ncbi:MAG: hypothetical protein Q9163_003843 [Psora crenata]
MTRLDLKCIHEPFGDAFYYGPERLSSRFENDEERRNASGFSNSSYKTVFDRIDREGAEGKRLFIKDIAHYLFPPAGAPSSIAPTLARKERGIGTRGYDPSAAPSEANGASHPYPYDTQPEPGNPTVIPNDMLKRFHFTFLIRHPRYSIPSFVRCTIPPLNKVTGFDDYMPSEAGYDELRRLFDYLQSTGQIGPRMATHNAHNQCGQGLNDRMENGHVDGVEICVVDADDLLDNPAGIIEAYCRSVGLTYDESMLKWDSQAHQTQAEEAFEKWKGFHEDAIGSCDLKPRLNKKKVKTKEEEDAEWTEKFGARGAKMIRETVDANVEDYEYLRRFALKA